MRYKCDGSGFRLDINLADEVRGMATCPFCKRVLKIRVPQAADSNGWKQVTLPKHLEA